MRVKLLISAPIGRPDLTTVLTKLHIFRLTQFSKIIFLDADVLPVHPISHLFSLPFEFSAVPDVGWPDIFNSGVLVLTPGEEQFNQLNHLIASKPSWDGGDQGLLNEWRDGDWNRLSFTYNTTPTAAYTYVPTSLYLYGTLFIFSLDMPLHMNVMAPRSRPFTSLVPINRGMLLPIAPHFPLVNPILLILSNALMTMTLLLIDGLMSMIAITAPNQSFRKLHSRSNVILLHGINQRKAASNCHLWTPLVSMNSNDLPFKV